jgi:hypothetical protein
MPGSLTGGGMADGLLAGNVDLGPWFMAGKEAISEIINVVLEANVDTTVKVPLGATAFACSFTFKGEPGPEMKLGSNLNATATGFPVKAEGFLILPLASGCTELKFKAATAPPVFQICFI